MKQSHTTLDALDNGSPFRKVRPALDVTAFGVNAIVLPPGAEAFWHYHDEQDELYFIHEGQARFEFADETVELGPGGLVHVPSTVHRRMSNIGDTPLTVLVVGGKDGYVGRDGQLVNMDDLEARKGVSSTATSSD